MWWTSSLEKIPSTVRGPEPTIGFSLAELHVDRRSINEHIRVWRGSDACRQTKLFESGPSKIAACELLGFSRTQLRHTIGLP